MNKKKIFNTLLCLGLILSISSTAYAASGSYTYANGYKMTYKLYSIVIGGKSGAAAETDTSYDARAFVSLFGYDSSGNVKTSGTKTQDFYSYIGLAGNGSKTYMSTHSLLDSNNKPIGSSLKLYN